MLKEIDNELIHSAQWLVRRAELFTPITRKDIATFFLLVLKWLLVAYFLVAIMGFTVGQYLLGVIGLLNSLIFSMIQIAMKKNLLKEQKATLPSEIVTRSLPRKCNLFIIIFLLPLFLLLIAPSVHNDFWEIPGIAFTILACIVFTFTILEYLLCTISLPPGEKKRREQEKEMKNMQGSMT